MAKELEKKEEELEEEIKLDEQEKEVQEDEEEFELNEDGSQKLDEEGQPIKKKQLEPWELSDENEQDDTKKPWPESFIRKKQKLMVRIHDKEDENAALKERISALEKQLAGGLSKTDPPKRPKQDDFETDEEYQAALDDYEEKAADARFERKEQQRDLQRRQTQYIEARQKEIDNYYEKTVPEFLDKNQIDASLYKRSEEIFRRTLDMAAPGRGDILCDDIIAKLGPDSGIEKVIYFSGRNEVPRNKIISLMAEDPEGIKLVAYIGQEIQRLSGGPKPKISQAAKPSKQLKGDATVRNNGAGLKRKFEEALKNNKIQTAFNLKKQAKAAGIDVSGWIT